MPHRAGPRPSHPTLDAAIRVWHGLLVGYWLAVGSRKRRESPGRGLAERVRLGQRLESQAETQRVPVDKWALMILAQAADLPQEFEAWGKVNRRRYDLISKQYAAGLDESEEAELGRLLRLVRFLSTSEHPEAKDALGELT